MKTIGFIATLMGLGLAALIEKKPTTPWSQSEITQDYVSIPAGPVSVAGELSDVEGFSISKYEISNRQYQEFLTSLTDQPQQLDVARIRTEAWREIEKSQPLQDHYHSYPGFGDFPVVNITREGAERYCQWLTEQFQRDNSSDYKVVFRLPTYREWVRAARGDRHNDLYAWGSPYLEDGEGEYQCNFRRLGEEQIHYDEVSRSYVVVGAEGETGPITDKVDADAPNGFGLHNVCGNVAELLGDRNEAVGGSWNDPGYDVRIESRRSATEASPYVGFRPVMIVTQI